MLVHLLSALAETLTPSAIPPIVIGLLLVSVLLVVTLMMVRTVWRSRFVAITPAFAAEQIIETMAEAVLVIDADGAVQLVNRAASELCRVPEAKLVGRPVAEVLGGPFAEGPWQALLQTGKIRNYELEHLFPQGHTLVLSVSGSVIEDRSTRQPAAVVCVLRDVTLRKHLEQERQRQLALLEVTNEELALREARMKELLADLEASKQQLEEQQRVLGDTNKRLEGLVRLRDEFVASVSHELRTPLTAVKEGVNLFLDGALGGVTEEQRDFLQTVDENIDRLTNLITSLLDLSKIEEGRVHLMRRRVDIHALIRTTLHHYQTIAGQRTLQSELMPVPPVFADPERIIQVLGNLFSNAVKFTKPDGTITFSVAEHDGSVAVSVSDDGIGIAKEDVPKLFQRFSQVGGRGFQTRGTGLGLALCKELVALHKGTISMTSESQKGSTVTFTLPIHTPGLALEEHFEDLVHLAERNQQHSVGLIALDCEPLLAGLIDPAGEDLLERVEHSLEPIRKHLHRDDVMLVVEPQQAVILAITDQRGVQAIVQRIQRVLHEQKPEQTTLAGGCSVLLGTALYPADGTSLRALLAKATGSLTQAVRVA